MTTDASDAYAPINQRVGTLSMLDVNPVWKESPPIWDQSSGPQRGLTFPGGEESPVLFTLELWGAPVVSLYCDGSVVYGEDYTPDDAAKVFWDAVAHLLPPRFAL